MNTARRIDVHQHVVPPVWAQALASHGGDPTGSAMPRWSPETAIEFMDSQEIETSILSLTLPSVVGWRHRERCGMARQVNEYTAGLVQQRPHRFGNFATLPLPDVDGAVEEVAYALDDLRADGVILLANYHGTYLADPNFDPLWAELDRRQAVVFIRPADPPVQPVPGVASPILDVLLDTTRAAVQLVLNGTLERHPGIRIILAHAGGFVPYASMRFAELASVFRPNLPDPDRLLESFRRFYFDTALSSGPALPTLAAFAERGRILFGTDFPYAPANIVAPFTASVDNDSGLSTEQRQAINHDNAHNLFPRLKQRSHAASSQQPRV